MVRRFKFLPISQIISNSSSFMEEQISFDLPYRFAIPVVKSEDFSAKLHDDVEFVNKAINISFKYEKLGEKPPETELYSWLDKIEALNNTNDLYEERTVLSMHLEQLFNHWNFGRSTYFKDVTHHSLQWYNACYLYHKIYIKKTLNNLDIENFVNLIMRSKSQIYLENISILAFEAIKNYYQGKKYLNPELFKTWKATLAKSPEDTIYNSSKKVSEIVDIVESNVQNKMNDYTKQNALTNKDYFNIIYSKLFNSKDIDSKEVEYSFSLTLPFLKNSSQHCLELTKLQVLKFCSHLTMILHPIPSVTVKGLNAEQQGEFDKLLQTNLRKKKFTSSRGMINTFKSYQYSNGKIKLADDFIKIIFEVYKRFTTVEISTQTKKTITDALNKELNNLEEKKQKITKFGAIEALILLNTTLATMNNVPYMDPIKIDTIKHLVKNCLMIAYRTANILVYGRSSDNSEKSAVFNFAKELAAKFIEGQYSLVFQVVINKHAFYVGIKSSDTSYTIMIINGAGLKLHEKDKSLNDSEFEDPTHGLYHVIGSQILDKDTHKEFLSHYIYKLITTSRLDYSNAKENIYLLGKDNQKEVLFNGFSKIFIVPAFQKLNFIFPAQVSDNCVIHNLKYAIKFLLNMSNTEYGIFENELLKNADKMISKFSTTSCLKHQNYKDKQDDSQSNEEVGESFLRNLLHNDIETEGLLYSGDKLVNIITQKILPDNSHHSYDEL